MRRLSFLAALLATLGPGLLVMLADTDVGNIVTAAQIEAQRGYRLLPLPLLLIVPLYMVQELSRPPPPSSSPPRAGRVPVQSVPAAFVLIAAVWAATGFYKDEPDQVGIVLRFGKWVDTRSSGLNFHLP